MSKIFLLLPSIFLFTFIFCAIPCTTHWGKFLFFHKLDFTENIFVSSFQLKHFGLNLSFQMIQKIKYLLKLEFRVKNWILAPVCAILTIYVECLLESWNFHFVFSSSSIFRGKAAAAVLSHFYNFNGTWASGRISWPDPLPKWSLQGRKEGRERQ